MKLFHSYLRDHRKLIAAALVLTAAASSLFWLYSMPLELVLYTWAVLAVVALCFLLPDFVLYRRKALFFKELKDTLPATREPPPFSGAYPESLLFEIVEELCASLRRQESEQTKKRRNMLEYYTLWVHQIKTPLSALDLILQSEPNPSRETLRQELFKVERYVEMVLGYLRLDTMTSDLRLEPCSIHEVVRQGVKKFAPQFIYQKLSLDFRDFDNRVITDEKWLLFVVEQLLSNALKYTKAGGVTIDMSENDVLSIRDTGVGISPEDLPRIFQRGFTGQNGRLDKTSSGLGLYLSKEILDKLQTPVEIISQLGQGTEVKLYLHRESFTAY